MKDYVFIGWSKNRDLAIKIKTLIDELGFIGVVGGLYENNPIDVRQKRGTVNETINYQMNHCDQSILLFQKIDDNLSISGNLIYELGYITAQYNYIGSSTKLHIFKIDITQADDNLFPSDLHGVWGTMINSLNKDIDEIATAIVDEFMRNQQQLKKEDKFKLLNDYHLVEFEMMKHFDNPTMSDYDLAKEILVYLQAAFCYQEQVDIKLKVQKFKETMLEKNSFSKELKWAVDYAELTLELFCQTIPNVENAKIDIEGSKFRKFLKNYIELSESISETFDTVFEKDTLKEMKLSQQFADLNDYESLLIAQIQEHVTYLILVYINSCNLKQDDLIRYSNEGIVYCSAAIENLQLLDSLNNNDMYIKLLLSYAYKNLATFCHNIGDSELSSQHTEISQRLRHTLYKYVASTPFIRPSLKDYIVLEYLLQIVDVIRLCDDEDAISDHMEDINDYIEKQTKAENIRKLMFNTLCSKFSELQKAFG